MSRWDHRPWRKAYVHEHGSFLQLPLFCRALARQLADSVCDDEGRVRIGDEDPASVIARIAGAHRGEVITIRRHLDLLFADGFIVKSGAWLIIPNFTKAQKRARKGMVTAEGSAKVERRLDEPSMKVERRLDEGWMKVGSRLDEGSERVEGALGDLSVENNSGPNAPSAGNSIEENRIEKKREEDAHHDAQLVPTRPSEIRPIGKRAPDPEPDPVAGDPPKLAAEQKYQRAYSAGIARGKGSGYVFAATRENIGALNSCLPVFAIDARGKPLRGEALLTWISTSAEAFANFVIDECDDAKFWSHYGPAGFLRWLNAGNKTPTREAVQPAQLGILPEPKIVAKPIEPEAPEAETIDEMLGESGVHKIATRGAT